MNQITIDVIKNIAMLQLKNITSFIWRFLIIIQVPNIFGFEELAPKEIEICTHKKNIFVIYIIYILYGFMSLSFFF